MLGDRELELAADQLAGFRTASDQHYATHSEILQKYATLMEDYKRLKSDYEEERDSRERYKQMARGQERDPFVLVLIDGDGYVFDDHLVSNGTEGGQTAARLLNQAVKSSLRDRGLDHVRIMVRVYANLAGLSKALSKTKLVGPDKRSLSTFTASFNRSIDLFDFVDAGDLKENADFKIRAMFRLFAENTQCKHIYFAGCHDVGYLSELTSSVGNRDRITLLRAAAFHPEFAKLGIRIEDFPNIFRSTPLEGQSISPTKAIPASSTQTTTTTSSSPSAVDGGTNVCSFYQKGMCKYGKSCRYLHVKTANGNGNHSSSSGIQNASELKSWRKNSVGEKSTAPFSMPSLTKNDNDFIVGKADPLQLQIDFATTLPQDDTIPRNEVPVNRYQNRLDAYIPPPSPEDKAAFQARIAVKKLCNNHHINGNCPSGDDCEYDHSPAPPNLLNCLKQVTRNNPCPRRGTCRSLLCLHGHICQKADCKYRGGKQYCKFPPQTHSHDLNLAQYVSGSGSRESGDGSESVNGKGSTPTLLQAESQHSGSDDEGEEGARIDVVTN